MSLVELRRNKHHDLQDLASFLSITPQMLSRIRKVNRSYGYLFRTPSSFILSQMDIKTISILRNKNDRRM